MFQRKISILISYIFHPLLAPTYGTLLLFHFNLNSYFVLPFQLQAFILLSIFTCTFILPISASLLLLKTKNIPSLQLSFNQDRTLPLAITAIFFLLNYYILLKTPLTSVLRIFILGCNIGVLLALIISLFWKISAHMIGIGGIVGMLIGISFRTYSNLYTTIIIFILISGIVGYARLYLKQHNPTQVHIGFLTGVLVEMLLYFML